MAFVHRRLGGPARRRHRGPDPGETAPHLRWERSLDDDPDPWEGHFADIDALLARTDQVLAGEMSLRAKRSHLVYDPEIDEGHNEDRWLDVVNRTATWPAIAAAAIAWDAWTAFEMYPRQPWLGLIVAAAILRARGLTGHLLPLVTGYRASHYRLQGREEAP